MNSRDLIKDVEAAGWVWHSTTGNHRHFKHPDRAGKITILHPTKDIDPKTVKSIREAAGLSSTTGRATPGQAVREETP